MQLTSISKQMKNHMSWIQTPYHNIPCHRLVLPKFIISQKRSEFCTCTTLPQPSQQCPPMRPFHFVRFTWSRDTKIPFCTRNKL